MRAAPLTPDERALADAIAGRGETVLALLRELVEIPSPTADLAGPRAVGERVAEALRAAGWRTRWETGRDAGGAAREHLLAECGSGTPRPWMGRTVGSGRDAVLSSRTL